MEVGIKRFGVDAWVQTKGIEFQVRTPEGTHLGDLVLDRRGVLVERIVHRDSRPSHPGTRA